MRAKQRQWALLAVAALAAIAAIVIVATRSTHRGQPRSAAAVAARSVTPGDMAVAAGYLGISEPQLRKALRTGKTLAEVAGATGGRSPAGLVGALVAAKTARLEAAVRAGKVPKTQERARLIDLRRRSEAEVHRSHAIAVGGIHYVAVATSYLGITARQLRSDRSGGRSLAEVAAAVPGRSAAGLIDALVRAHKAELDVAVGARSLSRSDEARLLAGLRKRVSKQVARKALAHG